MDRRVGEDNAEQGGGKGQEKRFGKELANEAACRFTPRVQVRRLLFGPQGGGGISREA